MSDFVEIGQKPKPKLMRSDDYICLNCSGDLYIHPLAFFCLNPACPTYGLFQLGMEKTSERIKLEGKE